MGFFVNGFINVKTGIDSTISRTQWSPTTPQNLPFCAFVVTASTYLSILETTYLFCFMICLSFQAYPVNEILLCVTLLKLAYSLSVSDFEIHAGCSLHPQLILFIVR